MQKGKGLVIWGAVITLVALLFPWLAVTAPSASFQEFYSYTPLRLVTDSSILLGQHQAILLLGLVPVGTMLLLIGAPTTDEAAALTLIGVGNALGVVGMLSFYVIAIGQQSFPSSPDLGFWVAVIAFILSLSGWTRGTRAYQKDQQFYAAQAHSGSKAGKNITSAP